MLRRIRQWAGHVGEIKIAGDETNPTIAVQITGVDTEGILEEMRRRRSFESVAARKIRKARTAPKRHKVRWRYTSPAQAAKAEEAAAAAAAANA